MKNVNIKIPLGTFRTQVRASNGLEYVINSNEIQNVEISLDYISKKGRIETVTFTLGLTTPISNSKNRETFTRCFASLFYSND